MGQKLTDRTALATTPDNADLLYIVDVSDTTDDPNGTSKQITVANLLAAATVSDASTTVKGRVELATDAETITGTDTERAVTPSNITAAAPTFIASSEHSATSKATPVDADEIGLVDSAASNVLKKLTWANLKATLLTYFNTVVLKHSGPQGYANNYKIVPSVTASDLTVAIKTLAGTDPSASDPVYVRIGDTIRTISAALSVTKNDGTNWFNAGSAELATKEIDYFVYLGYNATDGVTIGFSRIPGANQYSDFSTTTTNEKYCAISTITTAASTDYYENVGRFAATLSAGAGYTWTVPTFTASNLIQRPIYETRWLDILPTLTVSGGTVPTYSSTTYKYRVVYDRVHYTINLRNTSGGTAGAGANAISFQTPFDPSVTASDDSGGLGMGNSYENAGTICGMMMGRQSANKCYGRNITSIASITGADQSDANRIFQAQGTYQF